MKNGIHFFIMLLYPTAKVNCFVHLLVILRHAAAPVFASFSRFFHRRADFKKNLKIPLDILYYA